MSCANKFWWPAGTKWEDRLASEPGTGQLNPLHPKTFGVMINVLENVASIFPENFFHSGGDEILPACWKSDSLIQSFLSTGGTLSEVLEKFINFVFPFIVALDKTAIYWEDVILDNEIKVDPSYLSPEYTIFQSWKNNTESTKKIVQAGYRVIVSSSDYYYLDCGHGGFLGNDSLYDQPPEIQKAAGGGSWCSPFKTWQTVYNYDITEGLTEEEKELVLGGEVALWSEQADGTVVDARLWPRTSAMAEALWSGNRDETGKKRYAEATDRLNEWRHRMVNRGIRAEPIQPLWCLQNPEMCNTVHAYNSGDDEENVTLSTGSVDSKGFADSS